MAQVTNLADSLAAAASSIGNLLAQMEGSPGNALSSSDMFSNLLSQNGGLDAAFTAMQAATPQASFASGSSYQSSGSASNASSPDSLMRNLNNLAANLRQALANLRQQNTSSANNNTTAQEQNAQNANNPSTNGRGQTQSAAQNNDAPSSAATTTDANASTDATTTTTDTASSDDKQKLASILAELLLMTQMMMKNLQHAQAAAGGASAVQANAATAITADGSGANGGDPLAQMLAALEKTTQALQSMAGKSDPSNISAESQTKNFASLAADATLSTKTANISDLTTQLSAFNAALKNALALAQTQSPSAAANSATTATTQSSSSETATKNSSAQNDAASAETNQLLSAPVASTAQNAGSPTASQTLMSGEALAAADKANSNSSADFNSNSDNLGGGKNAAAFNSTNMNITAEGAQASGTYSFASTLSAARAMNGGTVGLPTVVDQVILQMNRSVKSGNDQMSLQLQPGDLGKITVKLDFGSDGKVQGTVTADNPQTLSLLQKDSRSLERALQDAGLRADPGSLQFNLGGQNGQDANRSPNQGNANGANINGTVSADASGDGSGDLSGLVDIGTLAETYYITPSGVNIQV